MNFGLYAHQIRRWVLAAVIPACLVAGVTYSFVKRQPSIYQTSATLYVQQAAENSTVPGATDVYTSQLLIPTYSQMILSPIIAQEVDQALSARYRGYRLESHGLTVGQAGSLATQPNTQLMTVTVTDTVPQRAAAAADAVASAFITKITAIQRARFRGGARAIQRQLDQAQANIQYVSQRITTYPSRGSPSGLANLRAQLAAYQSIYQTLLASSQEFSVGKNTALHAVQVFSPAQVPSAPIGPHPSRTALLLGFVALMLCAGGVFLYDYFDDTPRTPEEVEEIVGSPILGTVQQFTGAEKQGVLITSSRSRSPLAEAYRIIRTNLEFIDVDRPVHSLVVTSASPAEGKSTTASNLANVFAQAGRRVTLIDADLRRPSLHRVFELPRTQGLTNMLASTQTLNGLDAQSTDQANLTVIASGPVPPRPADLLGSSRMKEFMRQMYEQSDLVLIDSPPVLAVTDAAILSTVVDGVVLVVDPARSKRRDLRRTREAIEAVGGRIAGVVINRLSKQGSTYYYYYYQHNYGYPDRYSYDSAPERAEITA